MKAVHVRSGNTLENGIETFSQPENQGICYEIVSSIDDREAILTTYQQYIHLNKTSMVTPPFDVPTRIREM